jgi:hypothetical protein
MTDEQKKEFYQYIDESIYYEEIANKYGKDILNEVVYALQQAKDDSKLLMSLFEDSGMWNHAMCLNDITENENN